MSRDIFNPKPFDPGRNKPGYDLFHPKPFDPKPAPELKDIQRSTAKAAKRLNNDG